MTPFCGWILRALTLSENSPCTFSFDQALLVPACMFVHVKQPSWLCYEKQQDTEQINSQPVLGWTQLCLELSRFVRIFQLILIRQPLCLNKLTLARHPAMNQCVCLFRSGCLIPEDWVNTTALCLEIVGLCLVLIIQQDQWFHHSTVPGNKMVAGLSDMLIYILVKQIKANVAPSQVLIRLCDESSHFSCCSCNSDSVSACRH